MPPRPYVAGVAALLVTGALALAASPAEAARLHVCPTGPPACQHSSIQDAVDAAADGDRILVAAGTYDGGVEIDVDIEVVGAGQDVTTVLGGAVGIGVAAGADVRIAGITITGSSETGLVNDGGLLLRDSAVRDVAASSSLVAGISNTGDLVARRITVTGNDGLGAGGLFNGGAATIVDSTFARNSAAFDGGAIRNLGGRMTLQRSIVRDNGAQGAGGLFNGNGDVTVLASTFRENGGGLAGAIWSTGADARLTVESSALLANGGGLPGPGGIHNDGGSATVTKSRIDGSPFGGAVQNSGAMTVSSSSITENHSGTFRSGGLTNTSGGVLTVRASIVTGNSTGDFGTGGGIQNEEGAQLRVVGTTLARNTAERGGGLDNLGVARLERSLVTDNTATGDLEGRFGGGVFNAGVLTLRSTQIRGNHPDDCAGC